VLTALPLAWSYRAALWEASAGATDIPAAVLNAQNVKLSRPDYKPLSDSIIELEKYLAAELEDATKHNAWQMAQLTVALTGQQGAVDLFRKGIQSKKSDDCNCWKESKNFGSPHAATRNWVAMGFAKTKTPILIEDLIFILNSQHDNFWAPFSDAEDPKYASTYATAWSVLALQELLDTGLIDPSRRERVKSAIALGKGWLVSVRKRDAASWPDYPNAGAQSREFQGLSAFVLHVLHRLGGATQEMDSEWLDRLPMTVPNAEDVDSNGFPIFFKNGTSERDAVRHMKTPWMIMATVDAYPSGTIVQRARALHWLGKAARESSSIKESSMAGNAWAAAELTIGFRYLAGDHLF
jgi:hypothetical protein